MISDAETNMNNAMENQSLETADAIARAAHIWIRSLCLNELYEVGERQALAGGLVAGLCQRLELDSRVRELVTYVYALLDDEGGQALAISRLMLSQSAPGFNRAAYEKGRSEAAGIVEMLTYHGSGGAISQDLELEGKMVPDR
jgi:hypothetical protein